MAPTYQPHDQGTQASMKIFGYAGSGRSKTAPTYVCLSSVLMVRGCSGDLWPPAMITSFSVHIIDI
jgi:hypothetical protein